MTKPEASLPRSTDAEEARIQAGIAQDPDNPEITAAQFSRMRPAAEILPPDLYAALTNSQKGEAAGASVTLRLDPDVLDRWRATGPGWQTRMGEVLRSALDEGRAA